MNYLILSWCATEFSNPFHEYKITHTLSYLKVSAFLKRYHNDAEKFYAWLLSVTIHALVYIYLNS